YRRHCGNQDQLRDRSGLGPRGIMRRFAAACRMADMHCTFQHQLGHQRRHVCGISVHVVTRICLSGAAMTPPIMCKQPIALRQEEQQLVVPLIGGQRPAMMKDQWLRIARAPVLVKDLSTVIGGNKVHRIGSLVSSWEKRAETCGWPTQAAGE